MKEYTLFATCGAGLEAVVSKELKELGYETKNANGRVYFKGSAYDIAYTNIWLRTADRVKLLVGEFKATDFDTLFNEIYALAWEDILPIDAEFPVVSGRSRKSKLSSVPALQRVTKKAVAQKVMDYYFRKTPLPETGDFYPIEVNIEKDLAQLTLDTSGTSLFKRGYREFEGVAPLKENLAASLIKLTTWYPDRPLYDPTCGSGTIIIEAAMMGLNMAPGLKREFAAEKWQFFKPEVWGQVRKEAEEAINWEADLHNF